MTRVRSSPSGRSALAATWSAASSGMSPMSSPRRTFTPAAFARVSTSRHTVASDVRLKSSTFIETCAHPWSSRYSPSAWTRGSPRGGLSGATVTTFTPATADVSAGMRRNCPRLRPTGTRAGPAANSQARCTRAPASRGSIRTASANAATAPAGSPWPSRTSPRLTWAGA